ncbi:zinc finger, c4 type (two domains) domain-containing protein [Ditylenchus destructor]|nr:zinc finger, c4 type (two domains) domain-containing protein [Ditylenchus destructor]
MQAVNNDHLNTDDSGPTTSHKSLYSGSVSKALATSVDSLDPTKTLFDSDGQLLAANFCRDMEMPTNCLVCGHPTKCCHYGVISCHGCKYFFRRTLLSSKTFSCKLNGMCSKMNGKFAILKMP